MRHYTAYLLIAKLPSLMDDPARPDPHAIRARFGNFLIRRDGLYSVQVSRTVDLQVFKTEVGTFLAILKHVEWQVNEAPVLSIGLFSDVFTPLFLSFAAEQLREIGTLGIQLDFAAYHSRARRRSEGCRDS